MEFGSAERDEGFDTRFITPRHKPGALRRLDLGSESLTEQGAPETLHLNYADTATIGPASPGDDVRDSTYRRSEHETTDLPPEPLGGPGTWLNLDDVPHKLVENMLVEVFVELADSTAFPAGQVLRVIRHLASQPKIMIPIAEHGDDCKLRVHTVVTPDGPSLELGVHWPDSETPPAAATDSPPGNHNWVDDHFWISSDLPCVVAMTPHTILQDLARLPRLDAEAFAAQVERGTVVARPFMMVLPVPFTTVALVGWRPAKGQPRFTAVAQPSRGASEVHLWTVIG